MKTVSMCQNCPTFNLGDGNLATADALTALAERFDLDHVVFIDWQRQLQGVVFGLHHTGTAVFVLAVHHLQDTECYFFSFLVFMALICSKHNVSHFSDKKIQVRVPGKVHLRVTRMNRMLYASAHDWHEPAEEGTRRR